MGIEKKDRAKNTVSGVVTKEARDKKKIEKNERSDKKIKVRVSKDNATLSCVILI